MATIGQLLESEKLKQILEVAKAVDKERLLCTHSASKIKKSEKEKLEQLGKRKHHSHMTKKEIEGLFRRLKSIQEWDILPHALERLEEKRIKATYEDLVSTIKNSEIIEYRILHNPIIRGCEERVVIRSKKVINRKYNLHIVFSLTCQTIVTVWINRVNDRHETLRWELYDSKMKVLGV